MNVMRGFAPTPDRIIRQPVKCRGGYLFRIPPSSLWRYNRQARREVVLDWAKYGGLAAASLIGGVPLGYGMALVDVGQTMLPSWQTQTAAPGFGSVVLSGAGNYQALVFRAPKTGSLRSINVQISAVSGSPTLDFQFETVDATTGLPTGSLWGTNTSKTGVSVIATYQASGSMTADASVTKGDLLAAVVRYASGTSATTRQVDETRSWFPYLVGNGTKTPNSSSTISVGYSDGTYAFIAGTTPVDTLTTTAFSSATNPNHRGGQWLAPVPMRCVGGWILTSNANNFDAIIATDNWDGTADNDGTSNLTVSIDKDQVAGTGPPVLFLSSTSLTFAAGTIYRSLCKPGASNVSVYHVANGTINAALGQMELGTASSGTAFKLTTANNPSGSGSWTASSASRPYCGFWIDQFDDGTSTGGASILAGGGLGLVAGL